MLPKSIVKVIQIAAGCVVGSLTYDALEKGTEVIKKVVETKKKAKEV